MDESSPNANEKASPLNEPISKPPAPDTGRRKFLRSAAGVAGAGLLSGLAPALHSSSNSPGERPNILFVFADDHATAALGAYGGMFADIAPTPHLDRMADEGMLFHNAFATNSICAPSRATVLTGKYGNRNGVFAIRNPRNNKKIRFDPDQQTFPKLLRRNGYQTAIVGKWHLTSDPTGFDYWNILPGQGSYYNPDLIENGERKEHTGYVTNILTDLTMDWLHNRRAPDQPFMMMYHHKAPHLHWIPGLDHLTMFDDVTLPEPETLFADHSDLAPPARQQAMTIEKHLTDIDLKLTPPGNLTPYQRRQWEAAYGPKNEAFRRADLKGKDLVRWKYQRFMKDYLRTVASIDENFGRVMGYLEQAGLADNTVVIYSSDQGFFLGENGWFDKRWMYEESLKMPLLMRWPSAITPDSENTDLVQNLDFAETFLDLADAEIPDDMQGRSLVPLMKGHTPDDWRDSVYYHYYEFPGWHDVRRHDGVRTHRYKLIHYYGIDEWELFDLHKDPDELHNVYDKPAYADVTRRLKKELDELREKYEVDEFDEPPLAPNPREVALSQVLGFDAARADGATLRDTSGNGHNGTLHHVSTVQSRRGQALKFGGDSYVQLDPSQELDPTFRPLTLGAWCKPAAGDGVLFSHGGDYIGYSLYLKKGHPHFAINDRHVVQTATGKQALTRDKWVHLAAYLDPDGGQHLLVNGQEVASIGANLVAATPTETLSATPRENALVVGADLHEAVGDYDAPMHFEGLMADLRLYWGVLDEESLRQWAG